MAVASGLPLLIRPLGPVRAPASSRGRRHTLPASEFRTGRSGSAPKTPSMCLRSREKPSSPASVPWTLHLDEVRHFPSLCPELSLGGFEEGRLVAFIIGSLWDQERLTMDALQLHKPHGSTVHIHVLAVHRTFCQQGKGPMLMWHYLRCLPYVSEDFLVPYYQKSGFGVQGPSDITVEPLTFTEMVYPIRGHAFMRRNSGC